MMLTIRVESGPGMISDMLAEMAALAKLTGCAIVTEGNGKTFRMLASGRNAYAETGTLDSVEDWEPTPEGWKLAV